MMMLSVVHGFRSRINGNAEVSATGPTSRVNLASSASSGHLGATVPRPRSFMGLAPPLCISMFFYYADMICLSVLFCLHITVLLKLIW